MCKAVEAANADVTKSLHERGHAVVVATSETRQVYKQNEYLWDVDEVFKPTKDSVREPEEIQSRAFS